MSATHPKPSKSKVPAKMPPKPISETPEHSRLKAALREVGRRSGFKVDSEVVLNFSGIVDEKGRHVCERSIDIAFFGTGEASSCLIIFECKGGADIKEINKKISSWEADIAKMRLGNTIVVSSDENALQQEDIPKFRDIRLCHVFGKSTDPARFQQLARTFHGHGQYAWDREALAYYAKTSATIEKAAKYQILREFDITLESDGTYAEAAIPISQDGVEMFLLGVKPSTLLKIGYVYRRASGKPASYQRIVSKERIDRISQFLTAKGALLPNAIIIAFDDEAQVQKDLRYEGGKLHFPRRYSCAWIIDGQHRVLGFLGTKHATEKEDASATFKLPVVAFKSMGLILQNRTFVSINYNQKRIDPTLLCDLATELPDLKNELTWPSIIVAELNKLPPLKERVKIKELQKGRPITITSFARYALLEGLLGYNRAERTYAGPLQDYAPLHPKAAAKSPSNLAARKKQVELLQRYFAAVYQHTHRASPDKDPWVNTKKYGLLGPTGINALLLVLSRIMEKYPNVEADIHKQLGAYLKPLANVQFTRTRVAKHGGGWKGFRGLANTMLRTLNTDNTDTLRLFGSREKR